MSDEQGDPSGFDPAKVSTPHLVLGLQRPIGNPRRKLRKVGLIYLAAYLDLPNFLICSLRHTGMVKSSIRRDLCRWVEELESERSVILELKLFDGQCRLQLRQLYRQQQEHRQRPCRTAFLRNSKYGREHHPVRELSDMAGRSSSHQ